MEDDDEVPPPPPPPIPVLDEHDVAAVVALLIRTVRIDDELKRDQDTVAEANARIAANTLARSRTITAFGVFGFDNMSPDLWAHVLYSIGEDAYWRSIRIAKGVENPPLLKQMGGDEDSAEPDETGATRREEVERASLRPAPRIKDAILEYLQGLGETGANVREVRRHLIDAYGLNVHEKTPGMTLYRLLKEGLVRREGRTWYARSVKDKENEAPAVRPLDASEAGGAGTPPYHQPELTPM